MLCAYALSPYTPPVPRPQGCEKLHIPIGLLTFCARSTFLAVRWLEHEQYSNEVVAPPKRRKLNSDAKTCFALPFAFARLLLGLLPLFYWLAR